MAYNLWKIQLIWKQIFRNKKTRADLNFWAIDPKSSYVVDIFMAYILLKFQVDCTKIEALVC